MITYDNLTLTELFDLLAKKTDRLSELIANHQFQNEEYLECSHAIKEIQDAIQQKQKLSGQSSKNIQSLRPDKLNPVTWPLLL